MSPLAIGADASLPTVVQFSDLAIDRAIGVEHRTINIFGRISADVAAANVKFQRIQVALERRTEAATAARSQDLGVTGLEHLVEGLAVGKNASPCQNP